MNGNGATRVGVSGEIRTVRLEDVDRTGDGLTNPASRAPVRIYSREHGCYWRRAEDGAGRGFTYQKADAGVWEFTDALTRTSHCGPEKGIEFRVLTQAAPAVPDPLDALRAIAPFVLEDVTDEEGAVIEDPDEVCITRAYFDAIMQVRAAIASATETPR